MRAKRVPRVAVIFDFDDTLVKTDAKAHIYKDGRKIKSLTTAEFADYDVMPGEKVNLDDFSDPRFIINAKKYKMWEVLSRINNNIKMGIGNEDVFILSARDLKSQIPIYNFLKRNGIEISLDHVFTIGGGGNSDSVARNKEIIIRSLADTYSEVLFYDDSEENIKLASKIPGVKTRLVD